MNKENRSFTRTPARLRWAEHNIPVSMSLDMILITTNLRDGYCSMVSIYRFIYKVFNVCPVGCTVVWEVGRIRPFDYTAFMVSGKIEYP